jgi:hypothetical protein
MPRQPSSISSRSMASSAPTSSFAPRARPTPRVSGPRAPTWRAAIPALKSTVNRNSRGRSRCPSIARRSCRPSSGQRWRKTAPRCFGWSRPAAVPLLLGLSFWRRHRRTHAHARPPRQPAPWLARSARFPVARYATTRSQRRAAPPRHRSHSGALLNGC